MAVRPIDANAMLNELRPVSFESEHSAMLLSDVSKMMREWVERQPTLTPPNEPLTLEELQEMDEPTPVWWEKASYWCLCERGFIIVPNGNIYEFEETDGTFYRRPPEGEEDT